MWGMVSESEVGVHQTGASGRAFDGVRINGHVCTAVHVDSCHSGDGGRGGRVRVSNPGHIFKTQCQYSTCSTWPRSVLYIHHIGWFSDIPQLPNSQKHPLRHDLHGNEPARLPAARTRTAAKQQSRRPVMLSLCPLFPHSVSAHRCRRG